ncbi:MAG: hypothetical protein ABR985_17055 [Methanotrichaceae archaeon]|jgi:hypothetical protein
MFLIDDIILRSLGISMPPGLDMIGTIEQIQKQAYKEIYNPEKIKSQFKENRLLYEFGELTREEYERTNAELMHYLKVAEEILR